MRKWIYISIAVFLALGLVACSAAPATQDSDWTTYGHDYGNQRYSSLHEINSGNVDRLIPAYVFQTGVIGPFETSPLVYDGVMYIAKNTIYFTTGNPWPDLDGSQRPGDNLFTDCIIALDASTGKMEWYFQQAPHETKDLDAASPPLLFDMAINGRKVAALGEIGKTGIFYALDRETGRLLYRSRDLATVTKPTQQGLWAGGSSWSPVSFDPQSQLAIMSSALHLVPRTMEEHEDPGREIAAEWKRVYGLVSAVNVAKGEIVWQDEFDAGVVGGSLTTAGGVTFVGEGNGFFDALDTRNGTRLWQFQTGAGVNAPPVAFEADGDEFVAVASGGNELYGTPYGDALFVFRLDSR